MLSQGVFDMKRKQFTREFKIEAVRSLEFGNKNASDLAVELDIRRNQLYKWHEEIQKYGEENAFPGQGSRSISSSKSDEVARLKRELAEVKEERDILKKAAIFFAKEKQ